MNRYSIAALVAVAALCTFLSSGISVQESAALAASHIGMDWHRGQAVALK